MAQKSTSAQQAARSFRHAQTFGLNIPTANLRHIFPALVALPAEAILRKALIRAAKTSPTAGRYATFFGNFVKYY
jgi:hypothetical protein